MVAMINQQGFTLTEALISLIITGLLTSFSLPSLARLYDEFQLHQALAVLQSDLHRVRDYNMVPLQSGLRKEVVIDHDNDVYELVLGSETLAKRRLPDRVSIEGSGMSRISFTSSGNISRPGSFTVNSRYLTKRVVFSIGIGGIDIRD